MKCNILLNKLRVQSYKQFENRYRNGIGLQSTSKEVIKEEEFGQIATWAVTPH